MAIFNMANLATKAANFTPENAREMQKRSLASRLARIEREKAARAAAVPRTDEARTAETLRQLAQLDQEINQALELRQFKLLPTLTAAKERLWKLVRPTAGQLRPGRRTRATMPEIVPIPASPAANGIDAGTHGAMPLQ